MRVAVRVAPAKVAEIVTAVDAETAAVDTAKVAEVDPAGTVTLDGTVADALLSDSATTAPPAGATALRVTVPVDPEPPRTAAGLSATEDRMSGGGFTVRGAVWLATPNVTVIVTGAITATAIVVTVNVAVVAPCATVTLAGTVADALLLDSVTRAPPVGAAALSVTVPVELAPPTTLVGASVTVEMVNAGGLMVSAAVCVLAL